MRITTSISYVVLTSLELVVAVAITSKVHLGLTPVLVESPWVKVKAKELAYLVQKLTGYLIGLTVEEVA